MKHAAGQRSVNACRPIFDDGHYIAGALEYLVPPIQFLCFPRMKRMASVRNAGHVQVRTQVGLEWYAAPDSFEELREGSRWPTGRASRSEETSPRFAWRLRKLSEGFG
jgi:hypothetical protein